MKQSMTIIIHLMEIELTERLSYRNIQILPVWGNCLPWGSMEISLDLSISELINRPDRFIFEGMGGGSEFE
jgi:hypothetical protein